MNLATILIVIIILYVFTSNIATRSQMNLCLDKLDRIERKQQETLSELKEECRHEDAESQDDGYMYCPNCNEAFKEC